MNKLGNRIAFYIGMGFAVIVFSFSTYNAIFDRQQRDDKEIYTKSLKSDVKTKDNQLKQCYEWNNKLRKYSSDDSARTGIYLQMMEDKDNEIKELREENRRLKENGIPQR